MDNKKPIITSNDINKIMVLDNAIPEYIQNEIYDDVFKRQNIPYFYQEELSGIEGDEQYGFGLNMFLDTDLCETKTNHFFKFLQIPYLVANHLNLILNNIFISRIFLQPSIPNFKKNKKGIHTDMKGNHLVCLYYVNGTDGETVFYDDDDNELQRVSPKKGRVALFDGAIRHSATPPTKGVRVVINTCIELDQIKEFGEEKKN